jgi:hypothetical protein
MAKRVPTDEEILAQAARAGAGEVDEPLAQAVRYDPATRRVVVDLTSGATFLFPVDQCEGLAGQPDEHLAKVMVMPGGDGLGWPQLDVHFHVGSLVIGTFGGKSWMKHLRQTLLRQAGGLTSDAKAKAAKENGKKGGRPRKASAAS